MEEKKKFKKIRLLYSLLLIVLAFGLVSKTFQNDTFFNISIGKYILKNGIDMKEHFSWIEGLDYTYSHWAYDISIYLIYNLFGFTGVYFSVILLAAVIMVLLFNMTTTRSKRPIISFIITIIVFWSIRYAFAARSQIISFICFIIEIYCIEQFIDTSKFKYAFAIIVLSIIVANFHAATWPLTLVLFLPYLVPAFLNLVSAKNIYIICAKLSKKKSDKYKNINNKKYEQYLKDYEDYMRLANENTSSEYSKILRKKTYNGKRLFILFILVCFTGLITPIHDVPYTYVIKSMFGKSNLNGHMAIDYINEMKPAVLITNTPLLIFFIMILSFLIFLPSKLKLEHAFLILGLTFMSLCSGRYVYLLMPIGAFVLIDLITQSVNEFANDEMNAIEKYSTNIFVYIVVFALILIYTIPSFLANYNSKFIDEEMSPVGATQYILDNIDYKNMKIFNGYNDGSYLMFKGIKVFIDSRLDVYCSEFADTEVFKDYIESTNGSVHYQDVFDKYHFTHILLDNKDLINRYIEKDPMYKEIFKDEYFTLYEAL